ncbi:unnamed protein product [Calypogeia fissa]
MLRPQTSRALNYWFTGNAPLQAWSPALLANIESARCHCSMLLRPLTQLAETENPSTVSVATCLEADLEISRLWSRPYVDPFTR